MKNNGMLFILIMLIAMSVGFILEERHNNALINNAEYEVVLENNFIIIKDLGSSQIDTITYEDADALSLADYFIEQNR